MEAIICHDEMEGYYSRRDGKLCRCREAKRGNLRRSPRDAHPKNHQLSTKKRYSPMGFVVIDPKISIMIDNYASYNIRVF